MTPDQPLKLDRPSNPPLKKRIIIATEGMNTEPSYFSHLNNLPGPLRVNVIPRTTHSSPPQVLEELIKYLEGNIHDNDEYWLVLDVDYWTQTQKQFIEDWCLESPDQNNLVVSNPCFELWLILHFEESPDFKRSRSCKQYYKKNYGEINTIDDFEFIQSNDVKSAITRAENRDDSGDSKWPGKSGVTTVYKLAKKYFEN